MGPFIKSTRPIPERRAAGGSAVALADDECGGLFIEVSALGTLGLLEVFITLFMVTILFLIDELLLCTTHNSAEK
jgi:hypothetical protein